MDEGDRKVKDASRRKQTSGRRTKRIERLKEGRIILRKKERKKERVVKS